MKQILLIAFLIINTAQLFAQEPVQQQALTQADYLEKSKKQKTAAWIATGAGAGLFLVTVVAVAATPAMPTFGDDETESTGTVPAAIGLAGVATGVYLFIASGKNKKRAREASVFLDIEKAPSLKLTAIKSQPYPALGLRLSL